jgi:hypothetical protein
VVEADVVGAGTEFGVRVFAKTWPLAMINATEIRSSDVAFDIAFIAALSFHANRIDPRNTFAASDFGAIAATLFL